MRRPETQGQKCQWSQICIGHLHLTVPGSRDQNCIVWEKLEKDNVVQMSRELLHSGILNEPAWILVMHVNLVRRSSESHQFAIG